jgi:hypothetical protein
MTESERQLLMVLATLVGSRVLQGGETYQGQLAQLLKRVETESQTPYPPWLRVDWTYSSPPRVRVAIKKSLNPPPSSSSHPPPRPQAPPAHD